MPRPEMILVHDAYRRFAAIAKELRGHYHSSVVHKDVDRVAKLEEDCAVWRGLPPEEQDAGGPYILFEMGHPDYGIKALHRYNRVRIILRRYDMRMDVTPGGFIILPGKVGDFPPDGFVLVNDFVRDLVQHGTYKWA